MKHKLHQISIPDTGMIKVASSTSTVQGQASNLCLEAYQFDCVVIVVLDVYI